jgi:hypothetical protein
MHIACSTRRFRPLHLRSRVLIESSSRGGIQTFTQPELRLLNEAYLTIKSAPLRYYIEACPPTYVRSRQVERPSQEEQSSIRTERLPKTDWLEFWVRFVCGAVFGALFGFRALLIYYERPSSFVLGIVGIMLGFGLGAALCGGCGGETNVR